MVLGINSMKWCESEKPDEINLQVWQHVYHSDGFLQRFLFLTELLWLYCWPLWSFTLCWIVSERCITMWAKMYFMAASDLLFITCRCRWASAFQFSFISTLWYCLVSTLPAVTQGLNSFLFKNRNQVWLGYNDPKSRFAYTVHLFVRHVH